MPQAPFLALITPLAGEQPSPPLGIWGPNDPRPSNPIAGPGRPPDWGMANDPGYGKPLPPQPPLVIWGPGDPRPTHPIAGPGRGPNWGMANDPGYGIEVGQPPYPSQGPGFPTNPIAEPPWGWGNLPPEIPIPPDIIPERRVDWKYGWTASTGWIVVGIPTGNVPTPSK